MMAKRYSPLIPSVVLGLAVLGFNLLGDALRDLCDPRLDM